MEMADALVCLHDLVYQAIPQRFGDKLEVIYQSALPLPRPRSPSRRHFDICVIGHLRDEKDSLRAALAARALPASSRIRVIHLGKAHNESWAEQARAEMRDNPRYAWRGDVPGWVVRKKFVKTRLMVSSSIMEGGANVVSEAIVAGVPVIASAIPGSMGLLGTDYPGYYPVRDTAALAEMLSRPETDPNFLDQLTRACAERARLANYIFSGGRGLAIMIPPEPITTGGAMTETKKSNAWSWEERREIVREFRASGQTQRAFFEPSVRVLQPCPGQDQDPALAA